MTKELKPNTFLQCREDLEQIIPAEGPGQSGDEELQAIKAVLDDGSYTLGPCVKQFEEEFEAFLGVKYAHTTNACTTALDIAAKLIGIRPGDDVICPSISFVATSLPLRTMGANLIFPDVDPERPYASGWMVLSCSVYVRPNVFKVCVNNSALPAYARDPSWGGARVHIWPEHSLVQLGLDPATSGFRG